MANLNAGLFYFNVHTGMFPGGETRGQVQSIQ
ncbi:CHRD domain-containing protein [bacterium]|nr:MAG: CHRD domain-containing protein [bacterium]